MKKTNVSLSIERSVNNDATSTYAAGFNKEETAVVVNNERGVKLEEDFNKDILNAFLGHLSLITLCSS